jgi:hypothetical protein
MYFDIAPLLSNNPYLGRLEYDRTSSLDIKSYYNPTKLTPRWSEFGESTQNVENRSTQKEISSVLGSKGSSNYEVQEWDKGLTSSINLFAGDRTGEDRSSTTPY